MIQKIAFASIILLLLGLQVRAQKPDATPDTTDVVELPPRILKFSFLSLADPSYQSVQFAFEYRLKDNVYLQHEAGYIFGISNLSWYNDDFESERGLRFRSELRSYFNLHRKDMKFKYYFAPEVLLIYVTAKNPEFKGVNCIGGGCDYYRIMRTEDAKYVLGSHFKIGGQRFFSRVGMGFEYYAGLGIRYRWFDSGTVPDHVFWSTSTNEIQPSLVVGVKVGWAL